MIRFIKKLMGSCLSLTISATVCGIIGFVLACYGLVLTFVPGLSAICGWVMLVVGLLICITGIIDLVILLVKSILGKKWWYLAIDILLIVLYIVAFVCSFN